MYIDINPKERRVSDVSDATSIKIPVFKGEASKCQKFELSLGPLSL